MTPFLKVFVKSLSSHIDIVATDFARVFHTKSMQFVKPVGNRLAVPAEW
jgi:hypothetical protein